MKFDSKLRQRNTDFKQVSRLWHCGLRKKEGMNKFFKIAIKFPPNERKKLRIGSTLIKISPKNSSSIFI